MARTYRAVFSTPAQMLPTYLHPMHAPQSEVEVVHCPGWWAEIVGTYLIHPYRGYTTGPSASDRFVLQSVTNVGFSRSCRWPAVCDKARTEWLMPLCDWAPAATVPTPTSPIHATSPGSLVPAGATTSAHAQLARLRLQHRQRQRRRQHPPIPSVNEPQYRPTTSTTSGGTPSASAARAGSTQVGR